MATKDERPGLLSKVARFVRNPTRDWAELDHPQPEQDSSYDRQALKSMIERKRQNDFVRKREFDQLRKLRNRGGVAAAGPIRPSDFQNSIATDQDGRAVTLKKIDEIEAQMSRQWWKGKMEAPALPDTVAPAAFKTAAVPLQGKVEAGPATDATPPKRQKTVPADLGVADFLPTEMGQGVMSVSSDLPLQRDALVGPNSIGGARPTVPGGPGFSTSRLFAAVDGDTLRTDPELEEAAIRFANGDDAGAERSLLEALRSPQVAPESAWSWTAALLDLYRATDQFDAFVQAVQEFGGHLDGLEPQWLSLSEAEESDSPKAPAAPPVERRVPERSDAIWECPIELTEAGMEDLREAMASSPLPWLLSWRRLQRIAPAAMPLLDGLFASLCSEAVALSFCGADTLVQVLQAQTPSGVRSVDPAWWTVRLNALRTMQLHDEFELAALDYCVTYEVSPPPWEVARCKYTPGEGAHLRAAPASPASTAFAATSLVAIDERASVRLRLRGEIRGEASDLLASEFDGQSGTAVAVSCQALLRVDFSAAGSILNWVATRQAEGCSIQFRDVHRLVAAFFNVIGINEHARVTPRGL